jgi:hypothetical protein
MQNEETVPAAADGRLAAQMPDASGPPQAVEANDPVLRAIATTGIVLVAAGGLLLATSGSTTHTAGSTRSAKLRWAERQEQVKEAAQSAHAAPARPTAQPSGEGQPHD